jgi:CshA-type fibril repeat protein
MSALFSDSTNATPLLIAGGGGGAAGTSDFPGYLNQDDIGGGGGGGLAGTDAATPYDGGPGTQLAGGAGGTATDVGCDIAATAGSQNSGGAGGGKVAGTPEYTAGGGGGGGYFGGGGGACTDNETQQQNPNRGPGGGGSGYIASTGVSDADILAGSSAVGVFTNAASAGANDSLYDAGTGQGGSFQNGGNGEIVLEWVDGPTASAVTSTGTGTASQSPTITVPDGGSLRLLDADSNPVTSLVVPDEGTYTVDTETNVISFVPASSFHGPATPVNYRLTDSSSRTSDSTYTPTVTLPAAPTLTPITSSGGFGATQTKPVTIPDGDSLHLLSDATPVTTLAVAGQGTYSVNPTTGVVTFTPVAGFSGVADPVTLRLTDAYGQSSDASFTATVLANAPQAVASVTAPAVMKVVTQAQTFPVICKLTVRKAGHCDVTLVYQNTKGRYVIGTASVSSAQAGGTAGQLLTKVTLNATGHYLAYLGPIPTWVYASVTPYGSTSAIPAVTRTVVENYNLK